MARTAWLHALPAPWETDLRRAMRPPRARFTASAEIARLVLALAEHDRATAAHSRRVRRYALCAAEELGLGCEQSRELGLAALAHDVGKMCLPRSLLNKPGRLTGEECRLVRGHPVASELLLSALVLRTDLTAAVRSHHERYDGKGYPDGLEGTRIPLLARVLTVADAFDAMTSVRPFSRPAPWAEALDRLGRCAGSQFDPAVVEGFARALRRACDSPRGRGGRCDLNGEESPGGDHV